MRSSVVAATLIATHCIPPSLRAQALAGTQFLVGKDDFAKVMVEGIDRPAHRTEIDFFVGGHAIRGQGTFAFLHRHLKWPAPR